MAIERILGEKINPSSLYPFDYDTEHTLLKVRNGTQSSLSVPLTSEESSIEIAPVSANDVEIWPASGYVTIQKELIYYKDVEKNQDGKVFKLTECVRGIEGTAKNYPQDTMVSGNVVAQQHNQLVDAILAIEKTIGDINDELTQEIPVEQNLKLSEQGLKLSEHGLTASLNSSIRSLLGCCGTNDETCPDVEFEFNIGVPIPGGSEAEYCARIFGDYTSFTIDFGDGSFETTLLSGTHEFESGGPYTPVITVVSTNCTIVLNAGELPDGDSLTPPVSPSQPFHVPIPNVPDFPEFVYPERSCPGPLFNFPPISIDMGLSSLGPLSLGPITVSCGGGDTTCCIPEVRVVTKTLPSYTVEDCCGHALIGVGGPLPLLDLEQMVIGDRVLYAPNVCYNPVADGGIYEITAVGDPWSMVRTDDEILPMMLVKVLEGADWGTTIWRLMNFGIVIVGSTILNFQKFGPEGIRSNGSNMYAHATVYTNTLPGFTYNPGFGFSDWSYISPDGFIDSIELQPDNTMTILYDSGDLNSGVWSILTIQTVDDIVTVYLNPVTFDHSCIEGGLLTDYYYFGMMIYVQQGMVYSASYWQIGNQDITFGDIGWVPQPDNTVPLQIYQKDPDFIGAKRSYFRFTAGQNIYFSINDSPCCDEYEIVINAVSLGSGSGSPGGITAGCGLEYLSGTTLAVKPSDLAGVGLAVTPSGCGLRVKIGCGLNFDFTNNIVVEPTDLIGPGLTTHGPCGLAVNFSGLSSSIGCGLEINSGTISVKPSDLAGVGLTPTPSGCGLRVKIGCGLNFDFSNNIVVEPTDLAGPGLTTYSTCGIKPDLGCGLVLVGNQITVNPFDLAGPGLAVGIDTCDLTVALGCGLEFDVDDNVAINVALLAGQGLDYLIGTGTCELTVSLGCGLHFDTDDAVAVFPLDLAGPGLDIGTDTCDLTVKLGCGLMFDVDNAVAVKPLDLVGPGLEVGTDTCNLQAKLGCGLHFDAQNKIAVFPLDLAGPGLDIGTDSCDLTLKLGCGLHFDGMGQVAVFPLDLAGPGLDVGTNSCDLTLNLVGLPASTLTYISSVTCVGNSMTVVTSTMIIPDILNIIFP